jgi:hypothetical protein
MEEQKDHSMPPEGNEFDGTNREHQFNQDEAGVNQAATNTNNQPVSGHIKRTERFSQKFKNRPKLTALLVTISILVFAAIGSYFIFYPFAQDSEIAADKQIKKIETMTQHLIADSKAYKSNLPNDQKPKLDDIKKTAQERKTMMVALAKADPDSFLINAIRKTDKDKLVDEAKPCVEEQTTITGVYADDKVTVANKKYNLKYNKNQVLFIDPNSTTEFYGYSLDNELIISHVPKVGYKENTKSTTGKTPSSDVKLSQSKTEQAGGGVTPTGLTNSDTTGGVVIPGVPLYKWRDGCGPTATAMVVGYYDSKGYQNLVEGDASIQNTTNGATDPVSQMIASHSTDGTPRHYEDYSLPGETSMTIIPDKSELPIGDEHVSDSVADFAHTSWSYDNSGYGGTWSSFISSGFTGYVRTKYSDVYPKITVGGLNDTLMVERFNTLKTEIAANRPMEALIDTSGDGRTDHYVTIVGYREVNGYPEYASLDTWSTTTVRWAQFRPMSTAYAWGIWGLYTFSMTGGQPAPIISTFTATPTTVEQGKPVALSWTTTSATSVNISPTVGAVVSNGSYTVTPTATTTYTLTANSSGGTVTKTVTVTVTPPITPPPPAADIIPPAVSIAGLNNLASYSSGRYTVTGSASDTSGIAKIEILVSGKLVATCTNATTCNYILNIKKLAIGSHTITIKAYDKANPANIGTNQIVIYRVK